MTKVRCSVNTCEFWGEGDVCKANSIWIKNSMLNNTDDDLYEFSDEIGSGENAHTSSQTCCETMRPRKRN